MESHQDSVSLVLGQLLGGIVGILAIVGALAIVGLAWAFSRLWMLVRLELLIETKKRDSDAADERLARLKGECEATEAALRALKHRVPPEIPKLTDYRGKSG